MSDMNISIQSIEIREFDDLISVEVYGMTFSEGGEWLCVCVRKRGE